MAFHALTPKAPLQMKTLGALNTCDAQSWIRTELLDPNETSNWTSAPFALSFSVSSLFSR